VLQEEVLPLKHQLILSIFLCLALTPRVSTPQINLDARFALHAKDPFVPPTKAGLNLCPDPTDPGVPNYSPNWDGIDCQAYAIRRPTNEYPGPQLFLVVGRASLNGVGGASCGVTYNPDTGPGNGIDPRFVSWTGCSDGLEFLSDGGHGDFPAPGGGLRITWATCQDQLINSQGVHTVLGTFYVYAYSEDVLKITPNNNVPPGPELAITTCGGQTTNLAEIVPPNMWPYLEPRVHFGGTGLKGFNPCGELPPDWSPVEPITWGKLKALYSREREN